MQGSWCELRLYRFCRNRPSLHRAIQTAFLRSDRSGCSPSAQTGDRQPRKSNGIRESWAFLLSERQVFVTFTRFFDFVLQLGFMLLFFCLVEFQNNTSGCSGTFDASYAGSTDDDVVLVAPGQKRFCVESVLFFDDTIKNGFHNTDSIGR